MTASEKSVTASDAEPLSGMQRTYIGLLDDVMIRYSEDFVGPQFFNKMIAKNIFFGGGLYINDGYLINHPTARDYLQNEDSLLRQMLSTGFARILTRTSSAAELEAMPLEMAKQIDSFREFVVKPEWDQFKPIWKRIADAAFFNGHARGWPKVNMSAAFTKLVNRVFEKKARPTEIGVSRTTIDQLSEIHDLFLESEPEKSAARTKLENAGESVLRNGDDGLFRERMNEVMTLANQAYHYGFGMALLDDKEEQYGVTADTTIGPAFDEFLSTREVVEGQLDEVPLFWLPDDISFDRGEPFLKFIDPSTTVGAAKRDYLDSLLAVVSRSDAGSTDRIKDLQDTTTAYMRRIAKELGGDDSAESIQEAYDRSFAMGIGQVNVEKDGLPTAVAAGTPSLAISLHTVATGESREALIERFSIKDASEKYNPQNAITLGDIRPQIASLAFDREKAADFTSDLPRFD